MAIQPVPAPKLVWQSLAMASVCALVERVAPGNAKVLITGESGVGKDLVARLIHAQSPRAARPYIAVNCAAFTETLLETELFGHVRGAFTGAHRDKLGKLQLADGGTIMLDEVGEMVLRMQAMLLRFLENGELQPVGGDRHVVRADVRVLAATNQNLSELVAAGRFREDLWYRLNVVRVHVPPLRERPEDIAPLVDHIVKATGRRIEFTEGALRVFQSYRWPGNVRELQNVIEQLVWTVPGDVVDVEHMPPALAEAGRAAPGFLRERRRQVADELFAGVVSGRYSFWEHVYRLFLDRDITRQDLRGLVSRGLSAASGNYRMVLKLFGLEDTDYKRFMNFLSTHDCTVDYRVFRQAGAERAPYTEPIQPLVPEVSTPPARTNGQAGAPAGNGQAKAPAPPAGDPFGPAGSSQPM